MGQKATIRIQNKSTHQVKIAINDTRNVKEDKLAPLNGTLASVNDFLPADGNWQEIEGEPKLRIQKDGYFHIVATNPDGMTASTRLSVDHDHWWSQGRTCACQDAEGIALTVDIDKGEGGQEVISVRVYDNIPSASWMENLEPFIAERPLAQVCIPGTHDSCTYDWNKDMGASPDSPLTTAIEEKLDILGKLGDFISDGILDVVFERLCQCQDKSTMEQLQAGIRYLDLRVAYHPESSTFWSCHGVYCVPYETILGEIKQFMTDHPKEILLLDFNHFYSMGDDEHAKFLDLITGILGKETMASSTDFTPNSKVADFWNAGTQALCFYHHDPMRDANTDCLWHRFSMVSPWPNKNDTEELHDRLDEFVKKRNPKKFFVLQGILTPDGELIKEQILERRAGISIKAFAARASNKVVDWTEDDWKDENHNVVIVDFFEDCSMVQSILNLNKSS